MNPLPGKSAKKVVFHIGFPKTGSSALQAFLSANAAALDEGGVFYPYPEPNSVVATGNCTGNMLQIMYRDGFVEIFQRESGKRTNFKVILDEMYFKRIAEIINKSDRENVIFSSELFGSSSPATLGYFKETIFD